MGLGFGTGLGLDNSSIKTNHKMLVTKCDRQMGTECPDALV